jgi:hypothetical protein
MQMMFSISRMLADWDVSSVTDIDGISHDADCFKATAGDL